MRGLDNGGYMAMEKEFGKLAAENVSLRHQITALKIELARALDKNYSTSAAEMEWPEHMYDTLWHWCFHARHWFEARFTGRYK